MISAMHLLDDVLTIQHGSRLKLVSVPVTAAN